MWVRVNECGGVRESVSIRVRALGSHHGDAPGHLGFKGFSGRVRVNVRGAWGFGM